MIRKIIKVLLVAVILFVGGYQSSSSNENNQEEVNEINESVSIVQSIKFEFDDKEIIVKLEDNSATQDLISRLPMAMQFEDYNNTEKIYYLDKELDLSDINPGCTPLRGTLAYYVPWGNLCFFYHNFDYSDDLVPLGKVSEGLEYLEQLDTVTQVQVSLV
mgnify:FL=1